MSNANPKIDAYISSSKWPAELKRLRKILLACKLTEELKWGKPCYSYNESNLVILLGFKDYCALLFCKGALLKDKEGILVKAGENTQAARQARFTSLAQIVEKESLLKAYFLEAIEAEKAGLKVKYKAIAEHVRPEELQRKLDKLPALRTAFEALTPGRQRAYLIYISGAKQSQTREARVEKCAPRILKGKGLMDT